MEEATNQEWTPSAINEGLRQLPALIATASQNAIEAQSKVKEHKHTISMVEASVRVREIGNKRSAMEVVAMARMEHKDLYKEIVELEKEYEMKNARLQFLRDLFDSCRKAASIRIEEARRLEGTISRR